MKTFVAKPKLVDHEWYIIDGRAKILGRLAAEIAHRLRGKHKAIYTPHVDTGDYIVVINAAEIKVTGKKHSDKVYFRHTGFPGGIRETNFSDLQDRKPGHVLFLAVRGMLPKGPLGRAMLKKLKIYPGSDHPHQAQIPKELAFEANK